MLSVRARVERIRDAIDSIEATAFAQITRNSSAALEYSPAQADAGLEALNLCVESISARAKVSVEPIRTIHHLACTGGTVISKAIATIPNVRLLSEADPLSLLPYREGSSPFLPTDMIGLLRNGTRGVDEDLLLDVFRRSIETVHQHDGERGRYLVIRDHAHSQFCDGPRAGGRRGLKDALPDGAVHRAVVTVRHPLDSFASLRFNGWLNFSPPTLDEYAARYLQFLDAHQGVPRVKYEHFVANPAVAMAEIARALDLPTDGFEPALIPHYRLSGDSGRQGDSIAPRTRRSDVEHLLSEARSSAEMLDLCLKLGYPLDGR
jgi:hypothetical protein